MLPAQQRVSEAWYDGTADALHQNIDILRMQSPRFILVLAGDHVYKMDYGLMLAEHAERGAELSIACAEAPLELASAFGVMSVDKDSCVLGFADKPTGPASMTGDPTRSLVSMGIYVFDADVVYTYLRKDSRRAGSTPDSGRDVIPVDAYWEANMDLTRMQPDLNMHDPGWPIRTLEEHLPPAKFVFESPDARGQAFEALVSSGCIVSGASIVHSLLLGQAVHDNS